MKDRPNTDYEPLTDRETVTPGDRVRLTRVPSRMRRGAFDDEPEDRLGRVDDVVKETTHLGPSSTMEQELAIVKTDDGDESRVSLGAVNKQLDADSGGVSLIPLEEPGGDSGGGFGGGLFRGPSSPTDIGRTDSGRFDRPDTDPDVDPAPVARDRDSGRFGLDPFDITSSTVGTSSDELFGDFDSGDLGRR